MRRAAAILFSLVFLASATSDALASKRKRASKPQPDKYAAFVIESRTGEILYAKNADARRYPASLTKMMTIYMIFDALSRGQITMDTKWTVSAKAAAQPATNLNLRKGETISVRDVIRSLVVHSANDASVVAAEGLSKSSEAFAVKMTKKARQLGMSSTVFRNPNGLPDINQYTTARDMATLGMSLYRDFPQYFNMFKTASFTWRGRTYKSHNRVMGRFEGADGIKTGYIRMSGFNLVTSVQRSGYRVVGVVMGGQSAAARDSHMVSLLGRTFAVLEDRGPGKNYARVPVPQHKPDRPMQAINHSPQTVADSGWEDEMAEAEEANSSDDGSSEGDIADDSSPDPTSSAVNSPILKLERVEIKPKSKPGTQPVDALDASLPGASMKSAKPLKPEASLKETPFAKQGALDAENWGIQIGAYDNERGALNAAAEAVKVARGPLKNSKLLITDEGSTKASIHRARLSNLTEAEAKAACEQLSVQKAPCFVFQTNRVAGL